MIRICRIVTWKELPKILQTTGVSKLEIKQGKQVTQGGLVKVYIYLQLETTKFKIMMKDMIKWAYANKDSKVCTIAHSAVKDGFIRIDAFKTITYPDKEFLELVENVGL